MGKAAKAETWSRVTSQPPRGAASTQQMSGEAKWLRVGVGWQANLSKYPLAPSRDRENTKVTGQPLKAGKVVDPRANLWDRGQHSKLNFPTSLGEELTKQSCSWRHNTAAAWWKQQLRPHCISWQSYLTSQFQLVLWTEWTKHYSKASYQVRPHQSFNLYANTRIGHLRNNFRTFTKKVNFLCSLNLASLYCVPFFILIFIIPVLLTSPSLFSYP
jgi:hypothetical protein